MQVKDLFRSKGNRARYAAAKLNIENKRKQHRINSVLCGNSIAKYRLYISGKPTDEVQELTNDYARCANRVFINNVANGTADKVKQWRLIKN